MATRETERKIYITKLLDKLGEGSSIVSEYTKAREPLTVSCAKGHKWTTTANEIMSRKGYVCRVCTPSSTQKKTQDEVRGVMLSNGLILVGEYTGMLNKVTVTNTACNHTYDIRPSDVYRGRTSLCPSCKPTYNFDQEIINNNLSLLDQYIDRKTNLKVRNNNCGHTYLINPGHFLYDGIGKKCTVCGTVKDRFFTKLISMELVDQYATSQTPVRIKNLLCGHEYSVIPNNLVCAGSGIICRVCYPNESRPEQEMKEFIKANYTGWVVENDRSVISPKELDIVLPDLGIAFELNGEYWHSQEFRGTDYHRDKTNEVEAVEYQLIHITDIQWNSKQDIIKSRILSLLGKSTKVMARKCKVQKLEYMPREFLITNHIQGDGAPTSINYGLFYEEQLVAVMTFKRAATNGAQYELARYCSLLNMNVVGGASKLLKAFEREYNNPIIMSYAARDWSKGGLYKKLGFTHVKNTEPGYHYFKSQEVFSRQTFQKAKLAKLFPSIYDEAKSEKQIMLEAGYHRYYDSGNMLFIKNA